MGSDLTFGHNGFSSPGHWSLSGGSDAALPCQEQRDHVAAPWQVSLGRDEDVMLSLAGENRPDDAGR